ncbi:hypothetical protein Tco_0220899, partial [Tanacetum coccineum]
LLATPRPGCEIGESSAAAARQPGPTMTHRVDHSHVDVCTRESLEFCTRHHDAQKDRAAVRAEIEVLKRERLAYEQETGKSSQTLVRIVSTMQSVKFYGLLLASRRYRSFVLVSYSV